MTEKELLEKLREHGIELGQWQTVGGKDFRVSQVKGLEGQLGQLRKLLQFKLDRDLEQLGKMRELVKRMQHGGGSG